MVHGASETLNLAVEALLVELTQVSKCQVSANLDLGRLAGSWLQTAASSAKKLICQFCRPE